jgi:hypothetical protein
MKKRKSYSLFLLPCLLFLIACGTGEQLRVRVEMPRKTLIDLDDFDEVAITNFVVKEEAKGFDLNEELTEYFSIELGQKIKNKVSTSEIDMPDEDVFQDKQFWQNVIPDKKRALLFTGNLEYTEEVRKAIKPASKRRFEEPFPEESRIEERRFYSLSLQLYLIDAQTGEAVYERLFKESKTYRNPNQTGYFAFYDLMLTVRDKLFRQILGERQIQERYLIK